MHLLKHFGSPLAGLVRPRRHAKLKLICSIGFDTPSLLLLVFWRVTFRLFRSS